MHVLIKHDQLNSISDIERRLAMLTEMQHSLAQASLQLQRGRLAEGRKLDPMIHCRTTQHRPVSPSWSSGGILTHNYSTAAEAGAR